MYRRTETLRWLILRLVDRLKLFLVRCVALLAVASIGLLASVNAAAAADEATVVAQLQAERVYIEDGAEAVDRTVINNAITQAESCGIDLYVAVLAEDNVTFSAKDLRGSVGDGTIALFKPLSYDLASNDISEDRFNRAETIANPVLTEAFAHVAVNQFVEAACGIPVDDGGSRSLLWLALFAIAAVVAIGLLASMFGRGRRDAATSDEFDKRRVVLRDWAAELRAPVTELQAPVAATRSDALATMYNEALVVARQSESEIAAATTEPELDRIEIRIARAWMQLRDIRNAIRD